jgi:hypothetical protein
MLTMRSSATAIIGTHPASWNRTARLPRRKALPTAAMNTARIGKYAA